MGKITNICAGYYQSFLSKSIGKYLFYTILRVSIYHQIQLRTGGVTEIVEYFVALTQYLTRQGFKLKLHMLENESRAALKRKITGIYFI